MQPVFVRSYATTTILGSTESIWTSTNQKREVILPRTVVFAESLFFANPMASTAMYWRG